MDFSELHLTIRIMDYQTYGMLCNKALQLNMSLDSLVWEILSIAHKVGLDSVLHDVVSSREGGESVKTPTITVRVQDEWRTQLEAIAQRNDETLSDVIRSAILEYVVNHADK